MTTPEDLKHVLLEQIDGYQVLRGLLQRERECLVAFKPDAVEDLSKEKDLVVLRLRLLEEERIRLVSRFSREHGADGEVTLKRISELTGDDVFLSIRLRMLSLLQGIEELNSFNRVLIERSLSYVRNTLGFFRDSRPQVLAAAQGTVTREA